MRLEGKVAVITGAAAGVQGELMGFGGAAAWLFVKEGAKVVLSDINEETGNRTAAQLRKHGADAIFVRLDVTREKDWEAAIQATLSTFGKLDVMVNNAGTAKQETVEETTMEIWDGQMAVHAKGVFLGTRHAIPEMRKVGGGSIVNISSMYGIIGSPIAAAYHAAKGAIRSFTKAAAVQYAGEGVRVNSIHPGYVLTPMVEPGVRDHPGRLEWLVSQVPMGRLGRAEEVAQGILYLASDESSYVTGAELLIDGGVTAQ